MPEQIIKFIELTFEELKDNLHQILSNDIPVWRKNKEGKYVTIPLDRLEQFTGNNENLNIIFYIDETWKTLIKVKKINIKIEPAAGEFSWTSGNDNRNPYFERRDEIINMPPGKRETKFDLILDSLNSVLFPSKVIDSNSLETLINAVSDAFVITKVSLEDFNNDNNNISVDHIKKISRNTTALVQSIMGIVRNNQAANNFINMLGEKSTGSTVDHMNCVFLIFLPFCYYYNSYFSKGKIAKIRAEYKSKYYRFYKKLLPYSPPESLEDVFKGGMRELDHDKLLQYGIGAFLHDIGKMDNIDYFEGEGKYDRKIIMRHAPSSYNMIIKTREFDSDVAYLAALHHEYYNDDTGYGISKILFPDSTKKFKEPAYCLTYDLSELKNGNALAYVPVKILEIIDVFDALTDSKRRYRDKEFSVDEALEIMKTDFILKHPRLDPILFSIFVDFVNSHTLLKDKSLIKNTIIK